MVCERKEYHANKMRVLRGESICGPSFGKAAPYAANEHVIWGRNLGEDIQKAKLHIERDTCAGGGGLVLSHVLLLLPHVL